MHKEQEVLHGQGPCGLGPVGSTDQGGQGAYTLGNFFNQDGGKDGICKQLGPNCSEFNEAFML